MRKTATMFFVALSAATAPADAASHIVEIAWGADGRFAQRVDVDPGKFMEVCGKLSPGDVIEWRFDATGPSDFNLHYHLGKSTEYPARLSKVSTGQGTLRVSVREDYCWMWSNKSAVRTTVDVKLQR